MWFDVSEKINSKKSGLQIPTTRYIMVKYFFYVFTIMVFTISCKCRDEKQIVVYRMIDNKKIEKLMYKDFSKVYSIGYSSNGWQIVDSTAYLEENKLCYSCYFLEIPNEYIDKINIDNFDSFPRNYDYRYFKCEDPHVMNLIDSLGLSYTYLSETESLLRYIKSDLDSEINYNSDYFVYEFSIKDSIYNTAIINSFPPDIKLLKFGFEKQKGFIVSDYFEFEHGFYAQRRYKYKNNILDTVFIKVSNNMENITRAWEERFVIVR